MMLKICRWYLDLKCLNARKIPTELACYDHMAYMQLINLNFVEINLKIRQCIKEIVPINNHNVKALTKPQKIKKNLHNFIWYRCWRWPRSIYKTELVENILWNIKFFGIRTCFVGGKIKRRFLAAWRRDNADDQLAKFFNFLKINQEHFHAISVFSP